MWTIRFWLDQHRRLRVGWLVGRKIVAQHGRRIEISDVAALVRLIREAKGDDGDPLRAVPGDRAGLQGACP